MRHSDVGQSLLDLDADEAERVIKLPFACGASGCTKRFATHSKRIAHQRSHEDKAKYMCCLQHQHGVEAILYFPTWTELQAHHKTCHPPLCTWQGCNKTFANAHNLKVHMKRHRSKESEAISSGEEDEEMTTAEAIGDLNPKIEKTAKAYPCDHVDSDDECTPCSKVFRTKYARSVHIKNQHLGLKEYTCTVTACEKKYGNKRSLNRHILKHHNQEASSLLAKNAEDDGLRTPDDDFFREEGGAVPESSAGRGMAPKRQREEKNEDLAGGLLSTLTGQSYGESKTFKKRRMRGRVVACPWPKLSVLQNGEHSISQECIFRFSRLYDVQRHLESKHGVGLSQGEISALLSAEESSQLATPRRSASAALEE